MKIENVSNVFRPQYMYNAKQAFQNCSSLKSVKEKLRFRDGLVWVVGLTVEIKLRFQISPRSVLNVLNKEFLKLTFHLYKYKNFSSFKKSVSILGWVLVQIFDVSVLI